TATVTITVLDTSVPQANAQSLNTNEGTALQLTIAANETDGDALTYAIGISPAHGMLTPTGNGAYTYTPNAGYHGPDSFTFTASDGTNTSNTATVAITVLDTSVPQGNDQSLNTNEGTALPVTLSATDDDDAPT